MQIMQFVKIVMINFYKTMYWTILRKLSSRLFFFFFFFNQLNQVFPLVEVVS